MSYILKILILITFSSITNGDIKAVEETSTKKNEFPFAICIRIASKTDECHSNGVLLNYYSVLTSCLCLYERVPIAGYNGVLRSPGKVELLAGTPVPLDETIPYKTKAWKLIPHGFCRELRDDKVMMSYDYGLITTKKPFPNNIPDLIKPISLKSVYDTKFLIQTLNDSMIYSSYCTIIGWGWPNIKNIAVRNLSRFLLKIDVKVIDYKECETILYSKEYVAKSPPIMEPKGKLCTKYDKEADIEQELCDDDGTLICNGTVIAISSEIIKGSCISKNIPRLYSRIDFISGWLKQVVYEGTRIKKTSSSHAESQHFLKILLGFTLVTLTL